jgi:hypothetical protein
MGSSRNTPDGMNSVDKSIRNHMWDAMSVIRKSSGTGYNDDDEGNDELPDTGKFESALLRYSRAIMKAATDFDSNNTDDLEKAISITKQAVISVYHGAHSDFDIERQKHTQELFKIKADKQDMEKELDSDIINLKAELLKEKAASNHWLNAYLKEEKKSQALLEQIEGQNRVGGSKKRKRMVKM